MSLVLYCSSQIHVNLSNTFVSWYAMCAPRYLLAVQQQVSFSGESASCMLPACYNLSSPPCSYLVVHGTSRFDVAVAQQGIGMHGAAQMDVHKEE